MLEIGSGYGQHARYFCHAMPGIEWQPSERAAEIPQLESCLSQQDCENLRRPITLDVLRDTWPDGGFNVVYTANTAHILPWSGVVKLFEGAAAVLPPGGLLIIYGPFNMNGQYTSPGNRAFDRDLRSQDTRMGLRDLQDVDNLGRGHHMTRQARVDMPANNMLLVFERSDS